MGKLSAELVAASQMAAATLLLDDSLDTLQATRVLLLAITEAWREFLDEAQASRLPFPLDVGSPAFRLSAAIGALEIVTRKEVDFGQSTS